MAQFYCNSCQEIIKDARVKCYDCTDFDLCLQCFSCGAEIGNHKRNHQYQIIDEGNFPIFGISTTWLAKEELALLDAVEQYGFGNWEEVAAQVETRTAQEVEEHYCDMYIKGTVGKVTWPPCNKNGLTDQTLRGCALSPSLSQILPPLDILPEEQQQLGYLPNRDDFEREFDNDAESIVSNLAITYDDEDVDEALKIAQTDIYTRTLKERLRRKRIAREYGLVTQFFASNRKDKNINNKKKMTREEKEFQERTKPFTRFHTGQEHQHLFESLRKEKELITRIRELTRYRRNGITKISECADFDSVRFKRERKKENKKTFGFILAEQWIIPPKVVNGVKKRRKKRRRRYTPKSSKLKHKCK